MNKSIVLIGFHNEKALGVKYLANALERCGYKAYIVFFKEFNSVNPSTASEEEIKILKNLILKINPDFVGLSVMSTLYLETVLMVNNKIREITASPIIWGGVYATLFPKKALEYADYVIRGEGEEALIELLTKLSQNQEIDNISNLAFKGDSGKIVVNDVRRLSSSLDELGYPSIKEENRFYISNNKLIEGDPQKRDVIYELSASRGCPFACSYCSAINIKRLYNNKGRYVRFRSVDSVIQELKEAINKMDRIKVVHFWDEIFSDDISWIEEFKERYKEEIRLPFRVWGHPLKIDERTIEGLVEAGLYQIVVGIQSGSTRIRREVFNRSETQDEIIEASKILSTCGVPRVIYDLMLEHPFEAVEDLKDTYDLCLKLYHPFELQIHGLNFLPGTDIIVKAISMGYLTGEELDKIMYSSIQEQYDMYWGPSVSQKVTESSIWISLIYLTQFPKLRPLVELLSREVEKGHSKKVVLTLQKIMTHAKMVKSLAHKAKIVIGLK